MSDKQVAALSKASKKKKQEALEKTEKAIAILVTQKQKITIRSVARQAGVSVSYIYKYPELSYRIQTLREQQKYDLDIIKPKTAQRRNHSSVNLENRIKILEQEKLELIKKIEQLQASNTTVDTKMNSLRELQTENQRLRAENKQLKQELEYSHKNLQEAREFILSHGYNTKDNFHLKTRERVIQQVATKKTNIT